MNAKNEAAGNLLIALVAAVTVTVVIWFVNQSTGMFVRVGQAISAAIGG